ncbi:Catechol-2,3-dioxygenase [Geodia barretti]|uniref:Catechol-2,3-dioxygenase n=1 Tax=Geodia barretti TaxID=519541 RepID=A0AA35SZ54_GEOBA|nr:Catechol-2,3-dioxygenase [Geodia barretti]
MIEIIQLLGTSSLMALPAEAGLESGIAPEVNHYYLATDSHQRVGPLQALPPPGLGRVVQLVQRAAGAVRADVWRQPGAQRHDADSTTTTRNPSARRCRRSWTRTTDPQHPTETGGMKMSYTPKHLGHLVMRVRDMERSLDFYTRVMGLTIMERSPSGTVFMSANTEKSHELAIRAIGMDAAGPDHSIVGQAHMAWQMETFEDLQELYDRLLENSVRIQRVSDHGVSLGVYLLDPDDNEIEVYYEMPSSQWERHREGPLRRRLPPQLREPAVAADD